MVIGGFDRITDGNDVRCNEGPYLATHGASKEYFVTASLAAEYSGKGIDIQVRACCVDVCNIECEVNDNVHGGSH